MGLTRPRSRPTRGTRRYQWEEMTQRFRCEVQFEGDELHDALFSEHADERFDKRLRSRPKDGLLSWRVRYQH